MNEYSEPKAYVLRGDKRKTPETIMLRNITLPEIPILLPTRREFWTIDQQGKAARIRTNGGLKRWKTDPLRFEQSFMFGMYEHMRFTTQELLDNVYIEA